MTERPGSSAPAPAHLELRGLTKRFGELVVLDGVDLGVGRGELLALLGPSGSGKTTALRLLAGFETADAGAIRLEGRDVTGLPAAQRGFGMVFQHYALFPHMTVADNVDFGLHGRGLSADQRRRRIAEMLELVGLEDFGQRRPGEISGGQQQRVALARALAPEPPLLLLDEPLSNLDPALRERTRRQLREVVAAVGITTVLVTHEQEEAFEMGDRVAVLYGGRLQQVGSPEDLYERPATRFVASFIGHAATLAGKWVATVGSEGSVAVYGADGADGIDSAPWRVVSDPSWGNAADARPTAGAEVDVVIRPERLALVVPGAPGSLRGEVVERRYGGPLTYFRVRLTPQGANGGREVEVLASKDAAGEGDEVGVAPGSSGPLPRVFPAALDGNRAGQGDGP